MRVERFEARHAAAWDALVRNARNGLFLFERAYMDYHRDRFEDLSAIVFDGDRAVAAMPASIDRATGEVTSHGGLTFGGMVVARSLRTTEALAAIDLVLTAFRSWGGQSLTVRLLPPFLESYPSAELSHHLWLRGFALVRRDLSSAIPLADPLPINGSKAQAVAKARKAGLAVGEGALKPFHQLLTEVLGDRHATAPVHSLAELQRLTAAFPERIRLHCVTGSDGAMLAGVLVYRYPTAWHTQYMAASPEGRALGALDLIVATLIEEARGAGATWLSFGASTTDGGRSLNEGLLWQKESFGARSVVHDTMHGPL